MARRPENAMVLSTSQVAARPSTELVPFEGRRLSLEERRITKELHKQVLVMQATLEKGLFAEAKMGEMHVHSQAVFGMSLEDIMVTKDLARGTNHESYMNQFTARNVESLARSLLATSAVVSTAIGYEVNRSLYPQKPLGFLERLFSE